MFVGPTGFRAFRLPLFHVSSSVDRAPVSKALLIGVTIGTLALHIFSQKLVAGFRLFPDIFPRFQLWRIFLSFFTFQTGAVAMMGLILLYIFRIFERTMGSRKFAVRICCCVSACLIAPELFVYHRLRFNFD